MEQGAPGVVTRLVTMILHAAVRKRARRISLIEHAQRSAAEVWLQIDGEWREEMRPPFKLRRAMIESIAGLAAFDPDEESSGRFELAFDGVEYWFDVEILTRDALFAVALRPSLKAEPCN